MNIDTTLFIDLSKSYQEYERDIYLGIGGWHEDEKADVYDCLSSIIVDHSGKNVNIKDYKVVLDTKGFGKRIMEVRITGAIP